VGCVWGEDHQENLVDAVGNKIPCYMAAMAVNNEQLPLSLSFGLGVAIKHLLKPRQSKIVVCLAMR
jgi:hypothetical protein